MKKEVQKGDTNTFSIHFLIFSLDQGTPVKHLNFFALYAQIILHILDSGILLHGLI